MGDALDFQNPEVTGHEPVLYDVTISLRGVSPTIWRRLRLSGNTNLHDFHYIIQIAMGWDDEFSHSFHIHGKDYGISRICGVQFSDDPRTVFLDNFEFEPGDRFTYAYNF